MQHVVVVLPAQVVGDVGEGGAGGLGHAVVDDDQVVLAVGQRGRRLALPQAVLRVPLLDLPHFMPGDGSLCGNDRKPDEALQDSSDPDTLRVGRRL